MSVAASPALLPSVWKLLGLRWRINVNSFRHAKMRTKIFTILGILGVVLLVGFVFWVSWMLLGFIGSSRMEVYTGVDPGPFMDTIPVVVFTVMFLGILLTSFGVLLQAMYLSGDMDFLLAAPVPIRAVFVAKLLQAVLPNFSILGLMGLPLIYGLAVSRGYNLLFYPLVPIMMIALTLAAAGLSSLLVMLVVRVVPARRVAEVLGFVGATVSILCSQSGNLLNISRNQSSGLTSGQQFGNFALLLERMNNPWFPLNWAGRGLVEVGRGNWLTGTLLVALTLGLFAGAFWFALATAERWYYTGWAGMQVVARKKRSETGQPSVVARENLVSRLLRLIPAPVRGLVQKDFLVLRRDLRNLSQLVTPLIFGVIYAFAFLRNGPPPPEMGAVLHSLFYYSGVGVALMVGSNLVTRLGSMAFSQEGKNYWVLKVSPMRASHLLAAKFLVAYLPALVLGGIVVVGLAVVQNIPPISALYNLMILIFGLVQMAAILVAFGVPGANFTWDDPRKMNSGRFGCLGLIVVTSYSLITFVLFVGPPLLAIFIAQPEIYGMLIGLALGSIFSVGGGLSALWLAKNGVERLGEAS